MYTLLFVLTLLTTVVLYAYGSRYFLLTGLGVVGFLALVPLLPRNAEVPPWVYQPMSLWVGFGLLMGLFRLYYHHLSRVGELQAWLHGVLNQPLAPQWRLKLRGIQNQADSGHWPGYPWWEQASKALEALDQKPPQRWKVGK